MKSLLVCALLLAAGVAAADTITVQQTGCTSTQLCFNVPNDGGVTIDYISDATQYGRLLISINGNLYDSGLYYGPIPIFQTSRSTMEREMLSRVPSRSVSHASRACAKAA
jgi:hypothetical protein